MKNFSTKLRFPKTLTLVSRGMDGTCGRYGLVMLMRDYLVYLPQVADAVFMSMRFDE